MFSLFGGGEHHRYINAEQDVKNELFALLASARKSYLQPVGGIKLIKDLCIKKVVHIIDI